MCSGSPGEATANDMEEKMECDDALRSAWNIYAQGTKRELTDQEFLEQTKASMIHGFLDYMKTTLEEVVIEGGENHLLWKGEEDEVQDMPCGN